MADIRTEIHTGLTKSEAYKLMEKGHKVRMEYFVDGEYLTLDINGIIRDEKGCGMGKIDGQYWGRICDKAKHWMTINGG